MRDKIKKYRKKQGILPSSSDKIDHKKIELQKERIKLQTEKQELNKWLRENARAEMFLEEIRKSIKSVKPPVFEELPIQYSNKGAFLGFSDIHFGKEFKSLTNEYSVDIFKYRMELLLNRTIEICRKENISELNICNTSDSIEGMIRISQLMSLQFGITDMTINFARFIVEWLNQLSKYVEINYHHVPNANHSEIRPLGTPAGQFPKENMERIIIAYIHDMLKDNKRINVPEYKHSFAKFDLCGYKFLAIHGQREKKLNDLIKDYSMLHREFYDYVITAHYHHSEERTVHEGETNDREILLLPSVMGSDTYSDELKTGSKASAKLFIFRENYGKEIAYNIKLN